MVRCLQWLNPVQIGLRWSESKAQFNQTRLCLFGANRIPLWGANHLLMLTNHQPFVCLFVWARNNRIHPPSEKLLRFDNINRRWWWWLWLVCWKPLNHNTRGLAPKWNFRAGNWNHFHQITIGNRAGPQIESTFWTAEQIGWPIPCRFQLDESMLDDRDWWWLPMSPLPLLTEFLDWDCEFV